jgi:hypothetical protein
LILIKKFFDHFETIKLMEKQRKRELYHNRVISIPVPLSLARPFINRGDPVVDRKFSSELSSLASKSGD